MFKILGEKNGCVKYLDLETNEETWLKKEIFYKKYKGQIEETKPVELPKNDTINTSQEPIIRQGLELPNKKYKIIYADPPWSYNSTSKNGTSRGVAEKYYNTMSLEDIKSLPIGNIADENSLLFLWITYPHLHELCEILNAWGFKYKTVAFTWIKIYKHTKNPVLACGYWTRSNAEICILATRGKDYPRRISKKISQIIISEQRKHSQKPDEARKRIVELIGDLPRIELFARQKTEGWDVWGNEV